MIMRAKTPLTCASLAGALALTLGAGSAVAQEMEIGMRDFMQRCAACHGPRAGGDGPVADLLTAKPKDLRHLARENDGIFPFVEVYQAIDGRREIRGHGTSAMPLWGNYFQAEALDRGLPPSLDVEQIVMGRVLSLVYYLQAIQER